MTGYYGIYKTFESRSKNDAALLTGPDNLVGDEYKPVFHDGFIWLRNKFDSELVYFDALFSRELRVMQAKGWTIRIFLSFVAYSDTPDPGHYWGEAAVLCYDSPVFDTFAQNVSQKLMEGIRPDIELNTQEITRVLESDGSWLPEKRTPLPPKKNGTIILKSRQSVSEKLIEAGRRKNPGCYVISIGFIIALIALVVFCLAQLL